MFNHKHSDVINQFDHVKLINVKRLANILQTMISSNNRIKHSDFQEKNNYDELCVVNFVDPVIDSKGFSLFNEITAAESYSNWQGYKMDISFVTGIKDVGLLFTAEDSNSYAVLDISRYIAPSVVLSIFTSQDIVLEIYREIKMSDDIARKTVFAEPYGTFTTDSNFQGYYFDNNLDLSYRYYLVVKGTGVVDDIVARSNVSLNNQVQLHVKNIEHFGFDVTEKEDKGTVTYLAFDSVGCNCTGVELTKDNTILIGSNVDYGVTRVFTTQDCYEDIIIDTTVDRLKETFITTEAKGWIRTPFFYLDNSANAINIYVKVNNLISGQLKNFDVKLYAADNASGDNAIMAGYVQKTNLACFDEIVIKSYVSIETNMDPNKVIDIVEMFVRYGELGIVPLIVQNNPNGTLTTKVYDTVIAADYKVSCVDAHCNDVTKIKISARGCRKDNLYLVWTPWYELNLDTSMCVTNSHVFSDYRLFQFKIELLSENVELTIKNFLLEVV